MPARRTGNDALHIDLDACYRRAAAVPAMTRSEQAVVNAQLKRPARGDNAVVHRCVYGLPTVVRVAPRLRDGTPFPTVFWLTCPLARRHVGRLEADGRMTQLNRRLDHDQELATAYATASAGYVAFRDRLGGSLPDDPAAGGMPDRVKCLHVHLAHFLATRDNPIGESVYQAITPMPCPGPCVHETLLAEAYGGCLPPGAVPQAWQQAAPPAQRPNVGSTGRTAAAVSGDHGA